MISFHDQRQNLRDHAEAARIMAEHENPVRIVGGYDPTRVLPSDATRQELLAARKAG